MNEIKIILIIMAVTFVMGYDFSSYQVMRKMDTTYPKWAKWLLFGYNSFKVRQSYKRYKQNGGN